MRRRMVGLMVVCALGAAAFGVASPAGAAATVPGKLSQPYARGGNRQATVFWQAPKSGGSPITAYIVTPYAGIHALPVKSFPAKQTSGVIAGLVNGGTYRFAVAARNAKGIGPPSFQSRTTLIGLPSPPENVSVAPGNGQATVTWSAAKGNGSAIGSYIITPFSGSPLRSHPAHPYHSTATSEVVTGLTNETAYAFLVRARNRVGAGDYSEMSGLVTPSASPAISVAHNATLKEDILVNSSGITLYMFPPDGASTSSKAGALLGTWPLALWSGTATVGTGLDASKAAIAVQPDGTPALSYNGHLLYTFVYDTEPGSEFNTSEGFYVVTPAGNAG